MTRALSFVAMAAMLLAGGCASARGSSQSTAFSRPAPDFTLTDQHGATWTLSAHRGTTFALMFGYTHCRDTCPTTLAKLSRAVYDAHVAHASVIFVTLDPARDTPAVLARYVRRFKPAPIVALTGTRAQIAALERAYGIYAKRTSPEKPGNGYDLMHTAVTYVIDGATNERALVEDDTIHVAALATTIRTVTP